jgi:carboxymethylenebutenolidase
MRMRLIPVFAVICLFMITPVARAEASGGKEVKISSGVRQYSAFLFEPSSPGPLPAMIEIHGIDGMKEFDTDVSQKLAAAGYVTLEVDLYGRAARDYEDGLHLRDALRPHLSEDLLAAANYLRSLKTVLPDRVGAIGWCMGGGFVLQLAIADPTLAAGVVYYGPVVVDPDLLRSVHAPLLGYFGQEDRSIPVPAVRMLANGLKDAGNPMELHIIPEARHGFAEPDKTAVYMPDVSAELWENTLRFLNARLTGAKGGTASPAEPQP